MDDTIRSLILFILCAAFARGHAEVNYASPAQSARLERDFNEARSADADGVLRKERWTCDMYGVRSKMQIERDVPLYHFKRAGTAGLANDGDQPIVAYDARAGAFEGRDDARGLRDELRLTKDGRLVGKLSLAAQKVTVAYADCRGS